MVAEDSKGSGGEVGGGARSQRERLPPFGLTLLYWGFAYLCLALAFLALGLSPRSIGGFFYQAKMLAVVHLVTLGWVSSSILGALYLIAPMALRTLIPSRKGDYVAWALVVVGVGGMVAHFWVDEYNSMVWSGGTLWLGLAWVGARATPAVWRANIQGAVKLHITLAFANILMAGTLGLLIGLEKQQVHVLPGYMLHNVYGHAHWAALGWATMMVMGIAYRLLPMLLPAAMPQGRGIWLSAILLEVGLIGLVVSLPMATPQTDPSGYGAVSSFALRASALLIMIGIGTFLTQVVWMKRNPRPAPKGLVRPDFATLHAQQAIAYLAASAGLGAALAFMPPGAWKLRAAVVYGVFGLIGFLAQMVIGIAARLLPMFAWMHSFVASDFKVEPPSQYVMHLRGLQILGFVLWTAGVPVLAYGLAFDAFRLVSLAGWVLLAGLACNAINGTLIVRQAFATRSAARATPAEPQSNA